MRLQACAMVLAAGGGMCLAACSGIADKPATVADGIRTETQATPTAAADPRLDWWRDARFGMFIHWGLYSIPAGEWPGKGTGHAEWIRDTAQIPVGEYEKLRDRFNPVKFDADAWVSLAKGAGMQYVCITTKHHDGFCLFDSKHTDWSVAHTPFKRDIMKEIAEACRRQGVTPCWYHSIMDWHHPDYVPRRPWERDSRPATGVDFEQYNAYLNNQVTELLTNYGPIGVMWFDGQWEGTWNHERGQKLYDLCRKVQPNVIVNNRCDKGGGPFQMTRQVDVKYAGDYSTPEQEIPPGPLAAHGGDWETCMTMNDHWGYNSHDHDFKSTEDLIRKLADIASKGGNFLLNVGPTAEGEIPPESVQRLREIGKWMDVNGESIHGTQAGPFWDSEPLKWGRCTQKPYNAGIVGPNRGGNVATRLYLHVFDWPKDGKLVVPGIFNTPRVAFLLSDRGRHLTVTRGGDDQDALVIDVPPTAPDAIDAVVVLDVEGKPDVAVPPRIVVQGDDSSSGLFTDWATYSFATERNGADIHYTLDGTEPKIASPHVSSSAANGWTLPMVRDTTTISARMFRAGRPISPVVKRTLTKVTPLPAIDTSAKAPGISFQYFEGDWNSVPNFSGMKPAATGIATSFDRSQHPAERVDRFGFRYHGYLNVPKDGVYTFWTASDDGSNLYVDGKRVVDNDGLHSLTEKSGAVALAAGMHAVTVDFFEKGGGHELDCWWAGPGVERRRLDPTQMVAEGP